MLQCFDAVGWAAGRASGLSLASVKSRLVLPFWYRLTRVVLDKGPLNGCVCESRGEVTEERIRQNTIYWLY